MDRGWKIELYENANGDKPLENFFDSLDKKALLKIARGFELLEMFGLEGGYPHTKKVTGTNLWEYRILGSDNIRLFYVSITGKVFLILHAFKKKGQKTPAKEVKIARDRLQEYLLRKQKANY